MLKARCLFFKCLLVLCQFSFLVAEDNTWICIGPDDASIQVIAVDPHNNQHLLAGTIVGGLFVSTNGGIGWNHVNFPVTEPSARKILFHPLAPDTVFYATTEGIFRSNDNGFSWFRLPVPFQENEYRCIAIHPFNPSVIIAGSWGYIIRSDDGGASWREIIIGVSVSDIEFDPIDSGIVYAAAYAGYTGKSIFKSYDCGETWQNITNDMDSVAVSEDLEINHSDPSIMYIARFYSDTLPGHCLVKTTNGGNHWFDITPPQMQRGNGHCVVVSRRAPNMVFLGAMGDGIFRSSDGGMNWERINTGLGNNLISRLMEDSSTGILYVGTYFAGMYRSTDNGNHWEKISQNVKQAFCIEFAINTRNSDSLFLVTYNGLYLSSDKGLHWIRKDIWPQIEPYFLTSIDINKYEPNNIYIAWESQMSPGTGGVIRSTDGGISWNDISFGLPYNCEPRKVRLAYHDSSIALIYLAEKTGLYYSDDSGQNWWLMGNGLPAGISFHQVGVSPVDGNIAYVGCNNNGHYYRTTDGGVSWSILESMPIGIAPGEIVCDPISESTIYANCGIDSGLYISNDLGENWCQINNNLPRYNTGLIISGIAINPLNNSDIYVNSFSHGFYISTNSGNSWQSLNNGLNLNYSGGITVIDPLDTNQIYLATLGYSCWSIHRSISGINYQIEPCNIFLSPNYPNPFNSSTTIRYTIPTPGPITLDIYDILGRKVQTLLDISQPAGEYQVTWKAENFSSGMYFFKLRFDDKTISKPMLLLK